MRDKRSCECCNKRYPEYLMKTEDRYARPGFTPVLVCEECLVLLTLKSPEELSVTRIVSVSIDGSNITLEDGTLYSFLSFKDRRSLKKEVQEFLRSK